MPASPVRVNTGAAAQVALLSEPGAPLGKSGTLHEHGSKLSGTVDPHNICDYGEYSSCIRQRIGKGARQSRKPEIDAWS